MSDSLPAGRLETCDGHNIRAALVAATTWLERNAERINALNVFPVPDGDTGSNMWLTMQSAVAEANGAKPASGAGAVAHAASHGALMGARGNSGVILSQILRGIARALDKKPVFTASELAAALVEGAATAYKGVIKPVEGTILTVARESADAASEAAGNGADIIETLSCAVAAARESLARTPSLLPVLAEAGVVDAGGQGYVAFLEGMLRHFRGDALPAVPLEETHVDQEALKEAAYGYCTEFIVMGQAIDVDALRAAILAQGESVLVVGDPSLARIHVHTFDPGRVLSTALGHGTLHKIKIDNMEEQHQEYLLSGKLELAGAAPTALGSSAPRPSAEESPPALDVAIVAVAAGSGMADVFRSLGATIVVPGGQTMNPSTGELLQAVESAPADAVILLPNNSNIVLTAEQVQRLSKKNLVVVPTQTLPQGVAALMAFNYEAGLEENARAMKKAADEIHTIEITRAVRAARLDGFEVAEGDAIAIVDGKLMGTDRDLSSVSFAALAKAGVEQAELVTLYYGEGASREEAEALASEIEQRWPGRIIEIVDGGQPHYPYIISLE